MKATVAPVGDPALTGAHPIAHAVVLAVVLVLIGVLAGFVLGLVLVESLSLAGLPDLRLI